MIKLFLKVINKLFMNYFIKTKNHRFYCSKLVQLVLKLVVVNLNFKSNIFVQNSQKISYL